MKKKFLKKIVVISIIVLFIGASTFTSIAESNEKTNNNNTALDYIKNKTNRLNFLGDPPEEEWNRTYGGTGSDLGGAVQQTSDGGYIVTGYTSTYGAGLTDSWLLKTDENGNEQWNNSFGGVELDFTSYIQLTPDGGYIMTGMTSSFGPKAQNVWLIKTDENGNEQWNKTYGGDSWDFGNYVEQTSDGGYMISGFTNSLGAGGGDAYLIKTDENGNEQWNKTYGGVNSDGG